VILGLAARMGETRAVLLDLQGQVLKRFGEFPSPEEFSGSVSHVGVAATDERLEEVQHWLQPWSGRARLWQTPWVDAALAGAFLGHPGVLLCTEHWSVYRGCAAKAGPESICQALVMAREPNHRSLSMVHGEGGLEWLSREGLALLDQVGGSSQLRLRRLLGPHQGERPPLDPMRQRALAVRASLEELSEYPGPDPASLALLTRAARRLSDLLRVLVGRAQLPVRCPAAWWDGRLEGPLWCALENEFRRYLPQLHWRPPADDAGRGCAALIWGQLREEQRQALRPDAPPPRPHEGVQALSADAWRQLSRTTSIG